MPKRITDSDAVSFGKRLVALLDDTNQKRRGAGAYLAKRYKVSTVTANAWLNGEYKPNTATAKRIANDHGATFESLYFGPRLAAVGDHKSVVARDETDANHHRFPLLEGFAGMGRGDYIGDYPEVVQFVEVTQEWATQALRGVPPDAVRVITGRGPSMRGTFNDGDLVFLDSRVKEFAGDAAYCFRWNGLVYIKRLQQIDKTHLRILSANADYPPHDVLLSELEIGGRALAAWTLRPL